MRTRYPLVSAACIPLAWAIGLSSSLAFADESADPQPEADIIVEELVGDESQATARDTVNTANNPLADMVSVALHNYYLPKLNGLPDESANTFWLRLVTPFWKILPRVSLPIRVVPSADPNAADASITGLGDLNVFMTFVVTKPEAKAMFGLGPIYTAPTATDPALGHGKHEIGLAALTVWAKGIFLVGGLVNYQIGVGGQSDRAQTQFLVAQPFVFFQLGNGYYLRSAPIWYFDIEDPVYNVPFGLGIGKVVPTEKIVFNFFAEPQFAMAIRGTGQPAVQIFMGMNMQLKVGRKQKKSEEAARLVDQLAAEQSLRSQMQ